MTTAPAPVREIVPLAVTLDTEGGACVAGVGADRRWIRPEPVAAGQVTGGDPVYAMHRPVLLALGPAAGPAVRPEDRSVHGTPRSAGPGLGPAEQSALLAAVADPDVGTAFAGERSAGLVAVRPLRWYRRRSTGGRTFLRLEFTDRSGERFDWIVRDVRLLGADGRAPRLPALPAGPEAPEVYAAVGLTHPNGRFPGRFRGCHPLVVGLHPADGSPLTTTSLEGTAGAPGIA
ncbi:hypothetical protein ACIBCM_22725 [Streptomyces sp. NPDC051018]|uniref:hypothetical protein n=1 Tax=Streptomyces sp. NPDC051018 TaxID=3365639 RepID=UPI003796CC4F